MFNIVFAVTVVVCCTVLLGYIIRPIFYSRKYPEKEVQDFLQKKELKYKNHRLLKKPCAKINFENDINPVYNALFGLRSCYLVEAFDKFNNEKEVFVKHYQKYP